MTFPRPGLARAGALPAASYPLFRSLCEDFNLPQSNGVVLYHGPSALDGSPIVVIATGLLRRSNNAKTGNMVQTWILPADVPPNQAQRDGSDASVCGDCPQRPSTGGGCYVVTHQGPLAVWRTWKAGLYPSAGPATARALFRGAIVRFGSYGDPAAAPLETWAFRAGVKRWTGYTHQWKGLDVEDWGWLMASTEDSPGGWLTAQAQFEGWRTFRVDNGSPVVDALRDDEVTCPAAPESKAYGRTSCETCGLCMGTARPARSIVIQAHGFRAKRA